MLTSAINAADIIKKINGIKVKIINLPWLNYVDGVWLDSVLVNCNAVLCIEDHYEIGGQADFIQHSLNLHSSNLKKIRRIGLRGVPSSGTNTEVLEREGLDGENIAQALLKI